MFPSLPLKRSDFVCSPPPTFVGVTPPAKFFRSRTGTRIGAVHISLQCVPNQKLWNQPASNRLPGTTVTYLVESFCAKVNCKILNVSTRIILIIERGCNFVLYNYF